MSFVDFDFEESDCDSENELQDLQQLNAVLNSEEPQPSASTSQSRSPTTSLYSSSSKVAHELSNIETALSLNKLTDEKLRRLETILVGRLQECNQKLMDIMKCNKNNKSYDRQESFRYVNCGKPYFKDKSSFTPPKNEDTITMQKSGMYDFSSVTSVPGWTVKDKSQFLTLIHKMSQDIRKKEIESKILQLKRDQKSNPKLKNDNNIEVLKREMENVKNKTLKEVALGIGEEYDWEYIANKLNRRHTAQEYKALWKLFLHPSINKSSWSKNEHTSLQKIAHNNEFQDWDDIANKLGRRRTGYQCFVYFRTNMSNTFTGQKWSREEEEYLKRLIDFYREDNYIPWGKVATSMENRTKIQIYNKYNRLLEQRKGRFLAEEDAVILTCADHFGLDFRRMTSYLPGRSVAQLRIRYQILAKKRISTVWSIEEDNKLIKLLANQDSPTVYSSLTKYFPGKDRMHIRSRYITLVKWMKTHPNMDISRAPRRASRRLGHGRPLDNLSKAIENLKTRIQNEVEDRKCKKITSTSPDNVIEDAIMATLATQMAKDEEAKTLLRCEDDKLELLEDTVISSQSLNATNLRKLLILLKSKLNANNLAESKYCTIYPDLIKGEKEVSLVNMKSYSKKDASKLVVKRNPDIFGIERLMELQYVLPPHYATITGCKQLMAWVSNKKINKGCEFNLNVLIRKNVNFKTHFFLLMERFNSLFLWPMLLSNQPPGFGKDANKDIPIDYPLPTNDPASGKVVTIPDMKSNFVNESIDSEESEISKNQISLIDSHERKRKNCKI
ncbi:snRNA-activating protein complex subunit 4 [Battus philenor]|uniref:snRNA-activating protein complex subunit 4 n=1 Tax=Battus philenor TaxID=42288 RepID=UPI0035CEF9D9